MKATHQTTQSSNLHVAAVHCSWSGPISAVGFLDTGELTIKKASGDVKVKSPGLPCCPFCKSVLMQYDEKEWNDGAVKHEQAGATNYVEFLKWKEAQRTCWKTLASAAVAFTAATGKPVKLKP